MKFWFCVSLLVSIFAITIAAQEKGNAKADERYSAPIEWRRFRVSAAEASFLMPKLPVKNDLIFSCSEKRGVTFHAYANQAVYEFRFYEKELKKMEFCKVKEPFSEALASRIDEVRKTYKEPPMSEVDGEVYGRKVKIFRWERANDETTRWVFTDDTGSRWIEFAVYNSAGVKPEAEKVLNSLGPRALPSIEVLSGAESNLGDPGAFPSPAKEPGKEPMKQPLTLYSKPKPPYTDMARQKDIQGNVVLSVTFLANGGIGEITVVNGLPYGLTEQAISAARRMVFMPARENEVPVTSVRKVNYGFSIF